MGKATHTCPMARARLVVCRPSGKGGLDILLVRNTPGADWGLPETTVSQYRKPKKPPRGLMVVEKLFGLSIPATKIYRSPSAKTRGYMLSLPAGHDVTPKMDYDMCEWFPAESLRPVQLPCGVRFCMIGPSAQHLVKLAEAAAAPQ